MTKVSLVNFHPALVSTMKSALEAATVHVDNSSGKPTTSATKAKMASRILKNAAEGVTDADKLRVVAIEEGLCPAD